tara:strand:+ start:3720 stop:4157 length:438 start_codon:yes stop_codon:yes gene_type:complete
MPPSLAEVLKREVEDSFMRGLYAAVAYYEGSWQEDKKGDGGRSWSTFQIHDHWHPREVDYMGKNWSDYSTSLKAFRMVLDKQKQWTPSQDIHTRLAYYNEGSSWSKPKGQEYADRIIKLAHELQPLLLCVKETDAGKLKKIKKNE